VATLFSDVQHYPTFYAFVATINTAVPRLLPFLSGFIPFFFGYAVLALAVFGTTIPLFSTCGHTLRTLWSLLNGDNMHAILTAAQSINVWVAHIYMYSFIGLTIYVVLNIILATTQEAYFISRDRTRVLQVFLERALKQMDEMDGSPDEPQQQSFFPAPEYDKGSRGRRDTLSIVTRDQQREEEVFEEILNRLIAKTYRP
jgi:hypothetical protein